MSLSEEKEERSNREEQLLVGGTGRAGKRRDAAKGREHQGRGGGDLTSARGAKAVTTRETGDTTSLVTLSAGSRHAVDIDMLSLPTGTQIPGPGTEGGTRHGDLMKGDPQRRVGFA